MLPTEPAPHSASPVAAPRKWPPLLGLLAVLLFVTFGGFFFSGAPVTAEAEVRLSTPISVAEGMSIRPAEGWEIADRFEAPQAVILTNGIGSLAAVLPGVDATAEELIDIYVRDYLEPEASRLSVGEPRELEMPAGTALVSSYSGVFSDVAAPIEGEIIAVLGPASGNGLLDGWASEGTYAAVQPAIHAMARSVEVS